MSIINAIITACVGLVLPAGAAMTYHYREVDRQLVQKADTAARADMANARASLPKFDDKRYKGLVYRP
jgi:hypothetical protein